MRPTEKSKSHGEFPGRKWHNLKMFGWDAYVVLKLNSFGCATYLTLRPEKYTYVLVHPVPNTHNLQMHDNWVCRTQVVQIFNSECERRWRECVFTVDFIKKIYFLSY